MAYRRYAKRRRTYGRFRRRYARKRLFIRRRRGGRGYTRKIGFYRKYGYGSRRSGRRGYELKYLDDEGSSSTDGSIPTTGKGPLGWTVKSSFFVIPNGTGATERIGRKVTIKSLMIRYQITRDTSWVLATDTPTLIKQGTTSDTVRIIIALDRQTNGQAADISMLLADLDFHSYNSLVNKGRFTVLSDNVYTLNPTGISSDGTTLFIPPITINATFMKKLNLPIEYSGTTGAIGEIKSNNIVCFAITQYAGSPSTTGTYPNITINWKSRTRFADM